LLTGVSNVPDLTTDFVSAERKPAISVQEATS